MIFKNFIHVKPVSVKRWRGDSCYIEFAKIPWSFWDGGWFIFEVSIVKIYHSKQFSHSVMSDSLRLHGLQHTRPPCPSPTPGIYSNSCPLSQWCHSTISSSVIPFSSHLQSFSASGSFQASQPFASGGQSIGVSASAEISNEYFGLTTFRMDWLDLPAVQGTLKSLFQHHSSKASIAKIYHR